MAKVITYELIWICDDCSAELEADAECVAHEIANDEHNDYTQEVRLVLAEEE